MIDESTVTWIDARSQNELLSIIATQLTGGDESSVALISGGRSNYEYLQIIASAIGAPEETMESRSRTEVYRLIASQLTGGVVPTVLLPSRSNNEWLRLIASFYTEGSEPNFEQVLTGSIGELLQIWGTDTVKFLPDSLAPTLLSATIDATGTQIAFGFNESVQDGNFFDFFTVDLTGGAATLTYTSGDGTNTILFDISREVTEDETGTADYTGTTVEDLAGNLLAAIADFPVTNNSEVVPEGVPFDVVVNFSDGTGAMTAAKINNGTHGETWGAWTGVNVGNGVDAPAHTTIVDHAVRLPFPLDVGGSVYDGSEGKGLTFDHTGAPTDYDQFRMAITEETITDCIALYLAKFDVALGAGAVSYANDTVILQGGNYSIAQFRLNGNGSMEFGSHSEGSAFYGVPYTGGWVIVCVHHDATGGITEIFAQEIEQDGSDWILGDVLGAAESDHGVQPAGELTSIDLKDYLRSAATSTGSIKIKLVAFRRTDMTWPPYALTVPGPTALEVIQNGVGAVDLAWDSACQIHDIQIQVNGGAWTNESLLRNNNGTDEYTDTGLTDGASIKYRVRNVIGDQVSAWVETDALEIDDEPFMGGDAILAQTLGGTIDQADQRGFKFTVGASPITVTEVGLMLNAGMYSPSLAVKIYNMAGTELATANISTAGTAGTYNFTALGSPLNLSASTAYYCVTGPLSFNTIRNSTTVATSVAPSISINDAAEGTAPTFSLSSAGANHLFGPVNFRWEYT